MGTVKPGATLAGREAMYVLVTVAVVVAWCRQTYCNLAVPWSDTYKCYT